MAAPPVLSSGTASAVQNPSSLALTGQLVHFYAVRAPAVGGTRDTVFVLDAGGTDYAYLSWVDGTGATVKLGNSGTPITLGDDASTRQVWLHYAAVNDVSGNGFIYALLDNFNPASPSFLTTPSQGALGTVTADRIWHLADDDGTSFPFSGQIGHRGFATNSAAWTQAAIVEQFQHRFPIQYPLEIFNAYTSQATAGTDLSGNGRNDTFTAGTSADDSVTLEPTLWRSSSNIRMGSMVARDSSASTSDHTVSTSLSIFGYASRILLAAVTHENATTGVTACTFNGVSMHVAGSDQGGAVWYYLLDSELPGAGSYTLTATVDGASGTAQISGFCLYNAKQSAPEATGGGTNSGTSISSSITTVSNGAWVADVVRSATSTSSGTPGTGQYLLADAADTAASHRHSVSWIRKDTAGSTSTSWTTASDGHVHASIAIAPVIPLTLSTLSPIDNGTDVNPSSNLSITLSRNVSVGTGNVTIFEQPSTAPTVITRNTDAQNTNATSFVIDTPGTPQAGDLQIIGVAKDDNESPTGTWPPTGFSIGQDNNSGTAQWSGWIYRWCDGSTDPSTVTLTETTENWISRGWLIRGADPNTNPVGGTVATATSTAANPPSVTFPGLSGDANLVLYYVGIDGNSTFSAHPSGYTNTGSDLTTDATTGNRIGQAYGEKSSSTSGSDDPGALTNTSAVWKAFTIAVRGKPITVETIAITNGSKVSVSNATVTINPAANLTPSKQYWITVDSGAIIASDDSAPYAGITDTTSWSFTTGLATSNAAALPVSPMVKRLPPFWPPSQMPLSTYIIQANSVMGSAAIDITADFSVSSSITNTAALLADLPPVVVPGEWNRRVPPFWPPSQLKLSTQIPSVTNVSGTVSVNIESDFTVASSVTETIPSTATVNIESDFSVSGSVIETISATSASSIESDFSVSSNLTETIASTSASSIESDFTVSLSSTEAIPFTSAVSIESDFVVASVVTESIGSSSAINIESDFSVSSSFSESFTSSVAAAIESDFTVSASVVSASGIVATVSANIESDFTVDANTVEAIPGSVSVDITGDFSVASSSTAANPVTGTVSVSIENDFVVANTVTETIPSTIALAITDEFSISASVSSTTTIDTSVAVSIQDDFVVAASTTETIPGSVVVDITSDFSVSGNSTETIPLTIAVTDIASSFVVAASVTSLVSGDIVVTADITSDFSVNSTATESLPSSVATSIGSDFSVAAVIDQAVPVSGTIAVNIDSDFTVNATVSSIDTITSTVSVGITSDFSVSGNLTETIGSDISSTISNDFTVSITVAESIDTTVNATFSDDFTVSAGLVSIHDSTLTVTVDITGSFSVSQYINISNPNIDAGTKLEASWLPSLAPEASWQ